MVVRVALGGVVAGRGEILLVALPWWCLVEGGMIRGFPVRLGGGVHKNQSMA